MSLLERKKRMMLLISLAVILVILGLTGAGLVIAGKSSISLAKSAISGSSTSEMLADTENEENAEEDENGDNTGDFSDLEMEQLQYLMMQTGFGYKNSLFTEWATAIREPDDYLEKTDEEGDITELEKLFMLCTGLDEEDRPEYLSSTNNIKVDYTKKDHMIQPSQGIHTYLIKAQTEYNGEVLESGEYIYILAWPDDGLHQEPSNSFRDEEEAKAAAKNDLAKKVNEVYEQSDWYKWKNHRNSWIEGNIEYLMPEVPTNEYDSYFSFWAGIASYIAGISDDVTFAGSKEELRELNDILFQQVYDENDEEYSEIDNILAEYLENGEYDFKETDPSDPDNPGTDPDNPGTDPDNPGTDPDNPGTDPDNPGTDPDNPGTDPDDPGTVPPEEVEDPIPAEVQSIEITSPISGTYRAGQEVKFTVTFDKNIYGTTEQNKVNAETAPVLLIHFNDPNLVQVPEAEDINKQATFESASGKTLTYTYIIEEGDNGRLGLAEGDNFKGTVYNIGDTKTELTKIEKLDGENEIIADTIGPELPTIEVTSEAKSYKIGEEIEIKVTFGEKVYGNDRKVGLIEETVPVLNIKFGDGEIKNPKIKTIGEQELVYSYIIEQEDRGTLTIEAENAFDGTKTVYDEVGNKTEIKQAGQITGNTITANDDLTIIKLDKTEITLDLNGTKEETITATVEPAERKITWSTSDEKVATIDENGKITAIAIGETIITAKAEDGATAECKVTVKDTTNGETKVTLNKENITLDLGGTKEEQLSATVEPTELEVTWTSSDEKIAKVDETGKVTAIKVGTAEITAKAKDGTIAKCQVTVTDENETVIEPEEIKVNITNPTVAIDRTTEIQLKPELVPSNSNTSTKLTYKSSNEEVATVDENGKVTIKAPGTTIITVITENGKLVSNNLTVVETEDLGENLMLGDVSQDGKVDSTDLLMILRYKAADASDLTGTKHQDWKLEEAVYVLGDIDADGTVDTTDILKIQRYIAYLKSDDVKQDHPDWEIKNDWE